MELNSHTTEFPRALEDHPVGGQAAPNNALCDHAVDGHSALPPQSSHVEAATFGWPCHGSAEHTAQGDSRRASHPQDARSLGGSPPNQDPLHANRDPGSSGIPSNYLDVPPFSTEHSPCPVRNDGLLNAPKWPFYYFWPS